MGTRLWKGALAVALAASLVVAGCNQPKWVSVAQQDVPVVLQIVTGILTIIASAQSNGLLTASQQQTAGQIADEVKADLQLVQNGIAEYEKAPTSQQPVILFQISGALNAAATHISGILSALHIKNTKLQATIGASVILASSTLTVIVNLLPTLGSNAAVRASEPMPASPSALRAAFNQIAVGGGYPEAAIH